MIMSTRCCGFASLALLCTLAVICFQGVCGEDFSGPTVTECRPHIERALKEQLQHTGTGSDHFGSAEYAPTIEDDASIETPASHPDETGITSSENTVTVEVEGETSIEDIVTDSSKDESSSVEQTETTSAEDAETKSAEDTQTQSDEKSTEESKPESDEASEGISAENDVKSVEETAKSGEDEVETTENKLEEVGAASEEQSDIKSDEVDVKSSETEEAQDEKSSEVEEKSGEESDTKSAEEPDTKSEEVDTRSEVDVKSEEDEAKSDEKVAKSEEDDGKSEEGDGKSEEGDGKSEEGDGKSEEVDKTEGQSEEVDAKSEEDTGKSAEDIVDQSTENEKSDEEQAASASVETQSAEVADATSSEREEVDEIHIREERSAVSAEKGDESSEAQTESGEQGSEPGSDETQTSVETADADAASGENKEEKPESDEDHQKKESESEEEVSPKDEDNADESTGVKSSEKQDAPEGTTAEVAESSETIESTVELIDDEPVKSGEKSAEKSDEKVDQASVETKSDEVTEETKASNEEVKEKKSSDEEQTSDVQEDISAEKQESVETDTGEIKELLEDVLEQKSEEKVESAEKIEEAETAQGDESESEDKDEHETEAETTSSESNPEDELTKEFLIPENLRNRDHLDPLLGLSEELTESDLAVAKAVDSTLRELKRLYDTAIKPLEIVYKYRDLSNRHFGDPEIFSKPLVLFMGPWSGGKSSIINYLTNNEYNEFSLRTGAEPSPAYFNILMWGSEPEILDGTQLAADWTFSGLQKFGQGLEDRLRGLKLPNKLLEKVNIVEIPGILEVRKQVSRVFPFNDACQWFIDRADIIFLVYDPSKLDVGPETEAILDQLKGREYQTRILLNKADTVKPEELMRVQGALIWNISPLMSSAQPPVMYTTSLWSNPFTSGSPERLLMAQERAFLRDLRQAVEKRVENKISSARRFAVRVRNHAKMVDCYLTTYYNHKTLFGNRKQISDAIIERPQEYHIYEGLSTLTNISRYDLPDPDVYRDFFKLNPLYEFQQLSATCTYFRGCPINRLDVAIAYDLPELVGKYKKMIESAIPSNKPNNS